MDENSALKKENADLKSRQTQWLMQNKRGQANPKMSTNNLPFFLFYENQVRAK